MAKHKKKHSKKADASDDLLATAALSIKKFRKVTNELAKLSVGQKLVGGLALLAAGLIYLDQRKGAEDDSPGFGWPRLAAAKAAAPAKSSKSPKTGRTPRLGYRKPAETTDES